MSTSIETSITIPGVLLAVLVSYWSVKQQRRSHINANSTTKEKQERRMSFSSAAIAMGCMPDFVDLVEPVIQVLMSFENMENCPTEQDLIPLVQTLFQIKRMAGIPNRVVGSSSDWHFKPSPDPIDPQRMIRLLDADCDTIEEMADLVQQQGIEQLRSESRNLPWW